MRGCITLGCGIWEDELPKGGSAIRSDVVHCDTGKVARSTGPITPPGTTNMVKNPVPAFGEDVRNKL